MQIQTNLIMLIESHLGQGCRSGRWMMFHCPFPGHKNGDRKPSLAVTNGDSNRGPLWKCFGCGRHGGAIKWLIEYQGTSYQEAVNILGASSANTSSRHPQEVPIQQPDVPPGDIWQNRAKILIERAMDALWASQGDTAKAWLHARGLSDETIRKARLGYIPKDFAERPGHWGKPGNDDRPLFFNRGILIPGIVGGKVWYLKIRPSSPTIDQKYKHVRGGRQALYMADSLTANRPAVFCEGEFDALLLYQEIQNLASVITLASATGELNLATWGLYLLRPSSFILAHDMDNAGENGAAKLHWLHDAQRLIIPRLQPGIKDLTDFHQAGGNLYSLIESVIHPEAPIYITWPADSHPSTIAGQYWRLADQRIEAYYMPNQLDLCLDITHGWQSDLSF